MQTGFSIGLWLVLVMVLGQWSTSHGFQFSSVRNPGARQLGFSGSHKLISASSNKDADGATYADVKADGAMPSENKTPGEPSENQGEAERVINTQPKKENSISFTEYMFGKEGEFETDLIRAGVSPRRLFLFNVLGLGVALGGNLFGVTSGLLGASPETARRLQLDTIYPVRGFKRCVDQTDGYEFVYPQQWLADQAVEYQKQVSKVSSMPPTMATDNPLLKSTNARRRAGVIPKYAFGPPGGDFKENVSVIKSVLSPGFSLKGTFGDAQEGSKELLNKFIAPPGSGKEWTLLNAFEEVRGPGYLVYQFEYIIKTSKVELHNIGVVTARNNNLYTLIVLAPENEWFGQKQKELSQVASSFQLTF